MKIVQVCRHKYKVPPNDGNGSIEWLNYWLSEELTRRGHEVISYAPMGSACKGQVIHYPTRTMKGKEMLEFVKKTLPQNVDIIHDHTDKGDIARGKLDIPTIRHCHASIASYNVGIPVYPSKTLWQGKGNHIGYYLHNGIKLQDYQIDKYKKDYLLFMSRIVPQKGAHDAIEVAKALNKRLIIAGPIHDQEYFQSYIKPHLNEKIVYAGPATGQKKQDLLKRAKCMLLPTAFEEAFPIVTLEAFACGTPVVAYKKGGLPEQMRGMKHLLCNDWQEMAKIVRKGKFPTARECRSYIEQNYTIELMADNLLKIYKDIINKRN